MLNIISAVSSIITCLLFIFYIIGHVWSFFTNKSFNNERFENISSTDIDVSNATRAIVLDDTGTELSLTSSEGILYWLFAIIGWLITFLFIANAILSSTVYLMSKLMNGGE